jgi:hypothetical protein
VLFLSLGLTIETIDTDVKILESMGKRMKREPRRREKLEGG